MSKKKKKSRKNRQNRPQIEPNESLGVRFWSGELRLWFAEIRRLLRDLHIWKIISASILAWQLGGVILSVCSLNIGQTDMGINLGGFQLLMPQHGLDVPDVAAIFKQGSSERMAENMATSLLSDVGFFDPVVNLCADAIRLNPFTVGGEE